MSNLMKHLTMHRIQLKAEGCTMFDSLSDPLPRTSAASPVWVSLARKHRQLCHVTATLILSAQCARESSYVVTLYILAKNVV